MTIGEEAAYELGKEAYGNAGCWSVPPDDFDDREQVSWQEGFEKALHEDLGIED